MKQLLITVSLLYLLSACQLVESPLLGENHFPLKELRQIEFVDRIERLAVGDGWLAMATRDTIQAVDLVSGKQLWSRDFRILPDSAFMVHDGSLFAASAKEIIVLDGSGDTHYLALSDQKGDTGIIRLVTVIDKYLYVIRWPRWRLEAYDYQRNALLWWIEVGKGGADEVFLDLSTNTAFVSGGALRAINNLTGEVLWTQELNAVVSSFDAPIWYVYQELDPDHYRLVTIDTGDRSELWTRDLNFSPSYGVPKLSVLDEMLIIVGGHGLLALDKQTGRDLWQTDVGERLFSPPVEMNGVLYVKAGGSGTVFAISPGNGEIDGSVRTEAGPAFGVSDPYGGVYSSNGVIVFNSIRSVWLYGTP